MKKKYIKVKTNKNKSKVDKFVLYAKSTHSIYFNSFI